MNSQPDVHVFTVPQERANDTIRLRQAFGWTLISTSARTFATHADAVFAGASASKLFGGGARISFHNAHFVDLIMQRLPTSRNQQLMQLERQYEEAEIKPLPRLGWNLAGWLLGGYLLAVLVAVVALGDAPQGMAWSSGIAVGLTATVLLAWAWRRARRRIADENAKALAVRQSILQRIGALGGKA